MPTAISATTTATIPPSARHLRRIGPIVESPTAEIETPPATAAVPDLVRLVAADALAAAWSPTKVAEGDWTLLPAGTSGSATANIALRLESVFAFQPLEVGAHVRGMLVAQVSVFFQSLVDDVLQLGRKVRIQPYWRNRRAVQNGLKDYADVSPRKGNRPVAIS